MKKILVYNKDRCTGCKSCVLACSFAHREKFSLTYSRIKIKKDEIHNEYTPSFCLQCAEHPCQDVCPVDAIYFDNLLSILVVNEEKCIGCGACVETCPYNSIFMSPNKKALKCDLCGGEPECVKVCYPKAIEFVDINKENLIKSLENKIERIEVDR